MHINWYPGHMTKARRMLEQSVRLVDIVIQLLDARAPLSSTNPDLEDIIRGKKCIFVLNKADLADSALTKEWLSYYERIGFACEMNSLKKSRVLKDLIQKASRDIVSRYKQKGVNKSVRIMVVGIPNVGKSTLINTLSGSARTKTGDKPGVTRGTQWIKLCGNVDLLDTPGILWPKLENQTIARHLAYIGSIRDEILDLESLVLEFISEITEMYPDALNNRYGIGDEKDPRTILDIICRKRGFITAEGLDYKRASNTIFDEFRAGKLGRITLERSYLNGAM